MARARLAPLLVFGLVLLSATAVAQDQARTAFDTQLFQPPGSEGATYTIPDAEVLSHALVSVGLRLDGAYGTLRLADERGTAVPWRSDGELLFGVGLFEWVELELAAGVALAEAADDPILDPSNRQFRVSATDPRIAVKATLYRSAFTLGARVAFHAPLGKLLSAQGTGADFLHEDSWVLHPSLLFSYVASRFTLAGELGWRFRAAGDYGAFESDDELAVALGARYDALDWLGLVAEVRGRYGLIGRSMDADEMPMEADGGFRFRLGSLVTLDLGAGAGLTPGYGSPVVRGFAILRVETSPEGCAYGPEDQDGFEDGDFCAELDNDGDGVDDEVDECPNDAEDLDEFRDEDGCPDLDNDADGIQDDEDTCPSVSEDRDSYQDDDGCPEPDNDLDGVADGLDRCPMDPEDRDDFEDDDGCPEPGPNAPVVTVTDTRILISERIYFDFDTATIRSVSLPILNQVAAVIAELPRSRKIRVEGYTDGEGDEQYNLDLSFRRARSVVEYLVGRGVPRERLEYVGYGETRPVAPDDSPEGRALNRRVEFVHLEPEDQEPTRGSRSSRRRPRAQTGR